MSGSGLARAKRRAHQEREVACGGLDQELLVHVLKSSHVKTIQSAAVELMCEVPLDPLASLPLQPLATFALNAPPIAVHRFLLRLFAIPVAGSDLVRLRKSALRPRSVQPSHRCCDSPCPPPLLVCLPDALHTYLRASALRPVQPLRCRLQSPFPAPLSCRQRLRYV